MAVVTKYASGAQDPAVKPADPLPADEIQGRVKLLTSTVEIDDTDLATSTVTFGKIPSSARLCKGSTLDFDGINDGADTIVDALSDFDLGFAQGTGDDLIDAEDLTTAGSVDALSEVDIADLAKPAWELAGLDEDPGGELTIVGTLNADAGGDGTITLNLEYALAN